MDELRVIEVFAGIGAYSKGLGNLGINHKVVAAIEFDEKTMNCYNALHGTNFVPSDIAKVIPEQLPECDLFCYSPPCTTYSAAGKGEGINSDIGQLFYKALPGIKAKKPKFAVMENVKNLTGKAHRSTFDDMLKSLEDAGYRNYWEVLNANDYNVVQNRERVYVVSIRNDIEQTFKFPEPVELTQKLIGILEPDAILPILHNIYGGFGEKKPREFWNYSPTIRTAKGGGHIPSVMTKKWSNEKTKHFRML
jgi:DNA (cytosine-5)-methyltransferase 1